MKQALAVAAFAGIVLGRMATAFRLGWISSQSEPVVNGLLTQQGAMIHWLMRLNERMMVEFVFPSEEEKKARQQSALTMHEINCKNEHVELVEKLMDETSRDVVRDVASWAHGVLADFDLKLKGMTLEPDAPSDHDRDYDVVLVFHVFGDGKNALRFSAEASRKMRELSEGKESARVLRTDVRWM